MKYIGIYNYSSEEPSEDRVGYGHCYYGFIIYKKINYYSSNKNLINNLKSILYSQYLLKKESKNDVTLKNKILVIES